jgi:hypothetical protein
VHADLLEIAPPLETGHPALHHQQADALVARLRVGPRGDDDQVGQLAVRDERFLAGQHVAVAVAHGSGRHALQVAARTRLGHRDGRDDLPGAVTGQPALPLLRRGQPDQVLADDVVVYGEGRAVRAGPGEFLAEDEVVPVVGVAAAAVLLVDVDAEQARAPGSEPHVAGDDPVPFPLLVMRLDLPGDERQDHVTECVMLLGEDVPPHAPTASSCAPAPGT